MASLNNCQFIGNLARDPETRQTGNGNSVCTITIGCSETWKDKVTNEKKEETEWVRIVAFGKLSEIMSKYLVKGSQVYIAGRMKTRKYTNKDGIEVYTTEIIADEMKMLGSKPQGNDDGYAPAPTQRPAQQSRPQGETYSKGGLRQPAPQFDDMSDDIPF